VFVALVRASHEFIESTPRSYERAPIRGDVATRSAYRVSPKNAAGPVQPSEDDADADGEAATRRRLVAAADDGELARELSMKIDPELSGSEGISRVGRSPSSCTRPSRAG